VFEITDKIMSRVVRQDMNGKPSPDLAVSWTSNEAATEWTFKLRTGVKFHNGAPFGADDVVYSLQRVQDEKTGSPARSTISMIKTIEAVGPSTVKMTLTEPFADLPLILTDYRLRIIPKDSGATIATTGIGTGPFKLEKLEPQGTTVLVANPDYFAGKPGVARMEVIAIPDAQARLQALLGGQVDMVPSVTQQQRVLLERSNRHKVQVIPTGNWRGIVFNTQSKPFDDVRVRQAIKAAVDRKAMLELAASGGGELGCDTPVGPTDQYRVKHDVARDCPQDIAKAKSLLAAAGYPNGIDIDLNVATIEAVWPAIAEAFQQQVAPAGIRVKITQVPSDGYWTNVWIKKDAVMTRWNDRPADALLNEVFRSGARWNESRFADPKFDAILDAARSELNFDKRKAKYIEAQEHLRVNSGTLVAFHATIFAGLSARVKDLDPVEYLSIRWHTVKVD
jgi:peptide/nickel transport system substrate-binding protein